VDSQSTGERKWPVPLAQCLSWQSTIRAASGCFTCSLLTRCQAKAFRLVSSELGAVHVLVLVVCPRQSTGLSTTRVSLCEGLTRAAGVSTRTPSCARGRRHPVMDIDSREPRAQGKGDDQDCHAATTRAPAGVGTERVQQRIEYRRAGRTTAGRNSRKLGPSAASARDCVGFAEDASRLRQHGSIPTVPPSMTKLPLVFSVPP